MDDLVELLRHVEINNTGYPGLYEKAADEIFKLKSRNEDLEYTAEQDLRRLKEQNKYIEELLNVIRYVEPILVTNAMIEPRDKRTKRTLHLVQATLMEADRERFGETYG
jgi:hypothetical protein